MNKSTIHRQRILEVIKASGTNGVNSKILITTITPRYSARLKELRQEGHIFRTRREPIGGSNLIRIWYDGMKGQEKPKTTWVFNNETNRAYQVSC